MSASNLALEALKEFVAHFGEQHSGEFAEIGCLLCEVVAKGNAAIAALEAETGEPQGWKLVPIEPTPEMWKAGLANLFKDVDGVWKAMLEKAPKP